jgi:hypothetical protein
MTDLPIEATPASPPTEQAIAERHAPADGARVPERRDAAGAHAMADRAAPAGREDHAPLNAPAICEPTRPTAPATKNRASNHEPPARSAASLRRPRPVAYSMRALGREELPLTIHLQGQSFRWLRTVKHDFWAATGFYENDAGRRVVLKVSRSAEFAGLPFDGIGQWLCRREIRFYLALADLENVPEFLGRVGKFGFAHEFVPGRPLEHGMDVPDDFFPRLQSLLAEIHRRRIAYVDTNKMSNILLGDDGKPHLIDFQISFDLHEFGDHFLSRWLLRRFQIADQYHALKHKVRLRPQEATAEEQAAVRQVNWLIWLHRRVAAPYRKFRKTTFKRMRESGQLLPTGSE